MSGETRGFLKERNRMKRVTYTEIECMCGYLEGERARRGTDDEKQQQGE